MIQITRSEIEDEIRLREKIISQCNRVIDENNVLIKQKWAEIKDFVDGNSAEKARAGGEFIVQKKKEIRDRQTEIKRKEAQIADLKAKLKFKDNH